MGRNIGKSISKNLKQWIWQKTFDLDKQSITDVLKTASKRAVHKTAEATGIWLII